MVTDHRISLPMSLTPLESKDEFAKGLAKLHQNPITSSALRSIMTFLEEGSRRGSLGIRTDFVEVAHRVDH